MIKPFRNRFVFLLIFFFFIGCQGKATVPQHLIGVWKTSVPQYEDRYLKITEKSLIFGVGDGEEVAYTIKKIKIEQTDSETIYTFHYRDLENEKWTFTLIYRPVSGGTIQLKNRNEIWEKVKS